MGCGGWGSVLMLRTWRERESSAGVIAKIFRAFSKDLRHSFRALDLRRVALGIAGRALNDTAAPPRVSGLAITAAKIRGKTAS